ncbi:hypothetical protein Nmel_018276 [Mimus melanotis]
MNMVIEYILLVTSYIVTQDKGQKAEEMSLLFLESLQEPWRDGPEI